MQAVTKRSLAGAIALGLILLLVGSSSNSVYANQGPCGFTSHIVIGTWTIQYYSDAAHTTPWSPYVTGGLSRLACGSPSIPKVAIGQTIYIVLTATGLSRGVDTVDYVLGTGSAPFPDRFTCGTADATGTVTCSFSYTNNLTPSFASTTCIVDEIVVLSNIDGDRIDDLALGTQAGTVCMPTVAPEFPAGLAVIFAAA